MIKVVNYVTNWSINKLTKSHNLFLDFVHRVIFNEALHFGSRRCFRAPNLVDPLDRAVLSPWAQ